MADVNTSVEEGTGIDYAEKVKPGPAPTPAEMVEGSPSDHEANFSTPRDYAKEAQKVPNPGPAVVEKLNPDRLRKSLEHPANSRGVFDKLVDEFPPPPKYAPPFIEEQKPAFPEPPKESLYKKFLRILSGKNPA
jgi:hypothetical protein